MIGQLTEIKLIRLDSLLNIMAREIYEFSQTLESDTLPQRIDDFSALVASMKGIIRGIVEQLPERQDGWEIEEDLRALCRCKEIESDPKRQAAAQALAKKKMVDMADAGKV